MTRDAVIQPDLPYLTADVAGIGGRIRETPDDFVVEEIPLYLPVGSGEHLYLRITKRGLSTPDLISRLSSTLGVKARGIGVAGLKDARAVTTQLVSVHGATPERLARLKTDDKLLAVDVLGLHRNRLRPGHHAGNRFRIVLRHVGDAVATAVPAVIELLLRRGVPNFFGPQRQGRTGLNYQEGASLLTDPSRRASLPRQKRLWFLNAFQSHVFNQVLAARIQTLDRLMLGDWAIKHDNGACFPVDDERVEQPRADRFEISPTGPLFGSRAPWATGSPGVIEEQVVRGVGATQEGLQRAAKECGFRGERRPLRVKLHELEWKLTGDALTLAFCLPPGAYATNVLRELMKDAG
jgi:tRNA pseudouridine13 synthase